MTQLRIIGDVHGRLDEYKERLDLCEYSLQIGDMGFSYAGLSNLDPSRHRFFGGNHDNYDTIADCPNNLGDFGVWVVPKFGPIFWVRGGFSIDHMYRQKIAQQIGGILFNKTWWEEEEMSVGRCNEALELYKAYRPKMLVSHECPVNIVQHVSDPNFVLNFGYKESIIKTRTNQLLQAMTDFHPPKMHVFGHFHRDFDAYIDGKTGELSSKEDVGSTRYVCVGILNTLDLPVDFCDTL